MPVVGIGAGPHCDGQILVAPDVLGLLQGPSPKFSKSYDNLAERSIKAFTSYSAEVKNAQYPDPAHSYHMKPGESQKLQTLLEKP